MASKTDDLAASRGPRFTVVESLVVSKTGDPTTCEDVIVDGLDFVVVADGATDKSGLLFDGVTGGRAAATLTAATPATAASNTSASDLVSRVNEAYAARFGSQLLGVDRVDRPSASFVALDKVGGRIIRAGDCSWLSSKRRFIRSKLVDVVSSAARSAHLRSLLEGGATLTGLRASDPGRQLILLFLRSQSAWRNDEHHPLRFGAVDGCLVPPRFIEEWVVAADESELVLCSDGYPDPRASVRESEMVLAADVVSDPLRIGAHPSTKAVGTGLVSFDDRAFVRVVRAGWASPDLARLRPWT